MQAGGPPAAHARRIEEEAETPTGGAALHRVRTVLKPFVPRRLRPTVTAVLHGVAATALRGVRVECPCCGGRFRRFLAYPRPFCPRCGSYERHRAFALWLRRDPQLLTQGLRLLHVGPERALEPVLRRTGVDYVSIDLDYPLATHYMDVTKMTFEDASFDVALSLHVLQDVELDAALPEIARVLRPDGRAILQVPIEVQDEFERDVRERGFDVTRHEVTPDDPRDTARYGLLPGEAFVLARPLSAARG